MNELITNAAMSLLQQYDAPHAVECVCGITHYPGSPTPDMFPTDWSEQQYYATLTSLTEDDGIVHTYRSTVSIVHHEGVTAVVECDCGQGLEWVKQVERDLEQMWTSTSAQIKSVLADSQQLALNFL